MSILDKILRKGNTENPLYTKLKKSLSKISFEHKIFKAYFLFGLPYSTENLELLKSRISRNTGFRDMIEPNQYDVKKDNIEMYSVITHDGDNYFVLLFDPYELYAVERVLQVIQAPNVKFDFEPQLIFS